MERYKSISAPTPVRAAFIKEQVDMDNEK